MKTISTYEQQAIDFANKYGVELTVISKQSKKHFSDDKEVRDVYLLELKRGHKSFRFEFGQSIANSEHWRDKITGQTTTDVYFAQTKWGGHAERFGGIGPTMYVVLACLTKHDPESFEEFCSEFGYDTDSKKAGKIYEAVAAEWLHVGRMFIDCLEELQEIQ